MDENEEKIMLAERRREYDKSLEKVTIRLSAREKIALYKLMKDDGWTNVAGFIKDKIFGGKDGYIYEKTVKNADKKDIEKMLSVYVTQLFREFRYIKWKYESDLKIIKEASKGMDSKKIEKWIFRMEEWSKDINRSLGNVEQQIEDICVNIGETLWDAKMRELRTVSTEELRARVPWWDSVSPEAHELARRVIEEGETNSK